MEAMWTSGLVLDVALGIVGLELVSLFALRSKTGLAPADVIGQLAAGVLLMLALRLAVTGADWRLVVALVAASFPAHLYDLRRRMRT